MCKRCDFVVLFFNNNFMTQILYKEEVYAIIGYCIEVWKVLGYGFSEIIYKEAREQELIDNIVPHIREDELSVYYKRKRLKHKFKTDFTLFENIIIEVKVGDEGIIDKMISQTLNYLKASGCRIGLIINFDKTGVVYKRLIV
jgi:GxxExxY protein